MCHANLPTGFGGKTRYLHSIYCSTWTRRRAAIRWAIEVFLVTWSSSKLNCEAFSFEVTSICSKQLKRATTSWRRVAYEKLYLSLVILVCAQDLMDLLGTISLASSASSYSMKPKPFISLISVILPVPWLLKWSSMSCFVAE